MKLRTQPRRSDNPLGYQLSKTVFFANYLTVACSHALLLFQLKRLNCGYSYPAATLDPSPINRGSSMSSRKPEINSADLSDRGFCAVD